jgi:hypothetical protein
VALPATLSNHRDVRCDVVLVAVGEGCPKERELLSARDNYLQEKYLRYSCFYTHPRRTFSLYVLGGVPRYVIDQATRCFLVDINIVEGLCIDKRWWQKRSHSIRTRARVESLHGNNKIKNHVNIY